jgi:surface antigen
MHKIGIRTLLAIGIMSALVPVGLLLRSQPAQAAVATTVADAYAKQDKPNGNYNLALLESLNTTGSSARWTYLKFNAATAGTASLQLYQSKTGTGQIKLYATTNSWTETGLTWNNKPAAGALLATVNAPAAAGFVTIAVPSVVAGDNSFVVQSTNTSVNYQYASREDLTIGHRPVLTVTPAATPTPTPTPGGDPRNALFSAQNLIYGAQIGAWDMDGGLAVNNATAKANVQAARVKVIRWQMWRPPCDIRPTNCQTTAQFNQAIDGIIASGAVPLVGLPPIWNEQCANGPDPWSYAWQQWIVNTAGSRVKLYELANEPDNYCGLTGQTYHDQIWLPATGGAAALKKYARSLGNEIYIGGPAWANSYTANLADIQTWLAATKQDYLAHANDRDYLPDFVSTHTYLVTPSENDTQAHAQARIDAWGAFYDSLYSWIQTNFAGLSDQGYPIADELKIANSEYNDTIDNSWTGNDSQVWTDFYLGAMNSMFKSHHVWLGMEFTIASHTGGALDLLTTSGTAKPLYTSFKAISTADPNNP